MEKITPDRITKLLEYDATSGTFTWRVSRGGNKAGDLAGVPDKQNRCRIFIDGKRYSIAQLVWLIETGELPTTHLQRYDGDVTNNRFSNLYEVNNDIELSQSYIKENLHYCPTTGVFTWLNSLRPRTTVGGIAGSLSGNGYLMITINRTRIYNHILAWLYIHGVMPTMQIDHINHNKLDNSINNLREIPSQDNQKNMSLARNNTSGITGVWFDSDRNKWCAAIQVNNKTIHIGRYDDLTDAIDARKRAEIQYGFHQNHGK